MRIWALTRSHQKIVLDVVQDFTVEIRPDTIEDWTPIIDQLCQALDLSRPVILKKNIHELSQFSRTVFRPLDFMESVAFDRFEIEIFPEQKKQKERL